MVVYNDKLIIGGNFRRVNSVYADSIAAWDGNEWKSLGNGIWYQSVYSLAAYNGELIIGGSFPKGAYSGTPPSAGIVSWDGTNFKPLGNGITSASGNRVVYALTTYKGELIVGGDFYKAGDISARNIAAWNGSIWRSIPLTTGGADVHALTLYNDDLIVGSDAGIYSWDGYKQTVLVGAIVNSLAVFKEHLIAAGDIWVEGKIQYCAKWNGFEWQPLSSVLNGPVYNLMVSDGQLLMSGDFTSINGKVSAYFARWGTKPGDTNCDENIDNFDFAILAGQWIKNCTCNTWCDGADLDESGEVNIFDLMILCKNWLWMEGI